MKLAAYRKIAEPMNAEVKKVFEKFGFDTRQFRATIDENLGIVRISIELGDKNHVGADGTTQTPDAAYYLEHVKMYARFDGTKLKAEWLNATFRMGGVEYRLEGMRRKGKNNMLVRRLSDDSLRVTTEEQVVMFMGRAGIHPAENVGSTTDQARGAKPLGELLAGK